MKIPPDKWVEAIDDIVGTHLNEAQFVPKFESWDATSLTVMAEAGYLSDKTLWLVCVPEFYDIENIPFTYLIANGLAVPVRQQSDFQTFKYYAWLITNALRAYFHGSHSPLYRGNDTKEACFHKIKLYEARVLNTNEYIKEKFVAAFTETLGEFGPISTTDQDTVLKSAPALGTGNVLHNNAEECGASTLDAIKKSLLFLGAQTQWVKGLKATYSYLEADSSRGDPALANKFFCLDGEAIKQLIDQLGVSPKSASSYNLNPTSFRDLFGKFVVDMCLQHIKFYINTLVYIGALTLVERNSTALAVASNPLSFSSFSYSSAFVDTYGIYIGTRLATMRVSNFIFAYKFVVGPIAPTDVIPLPHTWCNQITRMAFDYLHGAREKMEELCDFSMPCKPLIDVSEITKPVGSGSMFTTPKTTSVYVPPPRLNLNASKFFPKLDI